MIKGVLKMKNVVVVGGGYGNMGMMWDMLGNGVGKEY